MTTSSISAVRVPQRLRLLIAFVALFTSCFCVQVLADEADAKRILKSMADYMEAQQAFAFDYDAVLEVVTVDGQKLQLASSGALSMKRPDKLLVTRHGGFADAEITFDGTTLTLFGKTANKYAQAELPGTVENAIDTLRLEHGRPLPAADLLLSDIYQALMTDVTAIQDLGSGVIGGVECDWLAFRTDTVDWQIWIAHGDKPYPCRYVITSSDMAAAPQYSIQVSGWKTGSEVADAAYKFNAPDGATKVYLTVIEVDMPDNFSKGAGK